MSTTPEPAICTDCGRQHGRFDPTSVTIGTFWAARCGWCGEIKPVTSPAEYGHPKLPEKKAYVGDMLDD